MTGFLYLASPYWSPHEVTRLRRVNLARKTCAGLMSAGYIVYSPVVHGHEIAKHLPERLRNNHEFWMMQDLPIVSQSDALLVLCLDGWEESKGITREIAHAQSLSIPVTYLPGDSDVDFADRTNLNLGIETTKGVRSPSAAGIS